MKLKKIKFKMVLCLLLIGISFAYIIAAYCTTLSMASEKNSVEAPDIHMSHADVEGRLNNLISYSIGGKCSNAAPASKPELSCTRSIVTDLKSERIIFEKNAYSKAPMASTTKIMTFIVATENCEDIYETVTVSRLAAYTEGSTMHLAEGETISLHDLLYGLLLNSGNDAAVAIAEHIGGSSDAFCEMMNDKAVSLGAFDTHFKTPHGLDREGHFTTAYDLAVLAKEAYKQPLFREIICTASTTLNGHFLKNTNPLLGKYTCVTGGKTGYTSGAGRCIVFFMETEDVSAVSVVLNCPTSDDRINDCKKLINYTTQNFKSYTLFERGTRIDFFEVEKGLSDNVYGIIDEDILVTLAKWEISAFVVDYVCNTNNLTAPISYNECLGGIIIIWGQDLQFEINIDVVAEHSVARKSYTDHLKDMIKTVPYIFGCRLQVAMV